MPSTFVGRAGELELATAAVRAGLSGDLGVLVIEGDPGIGKTRLVEEVLGNLGGGPTVVLRAAASELEQHTPFALLNRALAVDLGGQQALPAAASDAVGALIDVLEEQSSLGPTVLVLDDLHAADASSVHGFWLLSRHATHLPVALVATARSWPSRPEVHGVIRRLVAAGATHLGLEPLPSDAARELVHALLDPRDTRVEAALVAGAGNPLLLEEVAAALERGGGGADRVERGLDDRGALLLEPMARLAPGTVEVLRVAAALGSSCRVLDVASTLGWSTVDLADPIRQAMDAGLLADLPDRLVFRSPVLRDAIYDATPEAQRSTLHQRAGLALAESGAPAATVGAQLAAARDPAAVAWLRRAASELRSTAPEATIDLLESALTLLSEGDQHRDQLRGALVTPLVRAGRVEEAISLAQRLLAGPLSAEDELDARSGLALAHERMGERVAAAEQWQRAAALPGVAVERQASLLALAGHARFLDGDPMAAAALAAEAEELGRRRSAPEPLAIALTTRALVAGADGWVHESIALAEEAVALQGEAPIPWLGASAAQHYLGLLLLDADELERAGEVLAEGRRAAGASGSTSYLPFYYWELASGALLAGRLDDARAEAEAGLALAEESGTRLGVGRAHGLLARVALHRGERELVDHHLGLAEAEQAALGRQHGGELVAWVRALALSADGDPAAALEVLLPAWESRASVRWLRSYRLLGPTLAQLAAAAGDRALAASVAEVIAEGARRSGVAAAEGAALRARGHATGSAADFVAAVDAYVRGRRPLELALAREEAGRALLEEGERRQGAEQLRLARAEFAERGADGDVVRVAATLRANRLRAARTEGRPTHGWDALTPTEERVVALVARGMSNRRVAEELYLSRYTVETHLKHAYAKLGVSSRVELARLAESASR